MNRQRLIVPVLGAIAILLALNLVKGEPEAQAQHGSSSDFLSALPTVVAGSTVKVGSVTDRLYRFWSDGTVDVSVRHFDGTSDSCTLEFACGPEVMIHPGP